MVLAPANIPGVGPSSALPTYLPYLPCWLCVCVCACVSNSAHLVFFFFFINLPTSSISSYLPPSVAGSRSFSSLPPASSYLALSPRALPTNTFSSLPHLLLPSRSSYRTHLRFSPVAEYYFPNVSVRQRMKASSQTCGKGRTLLWRPDSYHR